jgi:xylulokinase
VQQVAPDVFGVPVAVPAPGEYVALGAARQAAGALAGNEQADAVRSVAYDVVHEPAQGERGAEIRAAYRTLRKTMHPDI